MLFLLFGSSAAGKTVTLHALRGRLPDLAIHDFDEMGVPPDADIAWRHRANEVWLCRVLEYQANGIDVLLAAQTPLGELLATPSAPRLDAISACLLDCDDETRLRRLQNRGPAWLERTGGALEDYLHWAAWLREHAHDPQWRVDVIQTPASWDGQRWERWRAWQAGDPRWNVRVIDTSHLPVDRVAGELAAWIATERTRLRKGTHPLGRWIDDARSNG